MSSTPPISSGPSGSTPQPTAPAGALNLERILEEARHAAHQYARNAPGADRLQLEPSRAARKQPIVTTSSALKKTTYKDQEDKTPRSLEYIRVQRAVLKYLESKPADGLTVVQARTWTKQIEPSFNEPSPQDAIRLCYYMRSQGYDVYSKVEGEMISLFIVNQRSNTRGLGHDFRYWHQNFKTNVVEVERVGRGPNPGTASGFSDILYELAYEAAPTESTEASQGTVIDLADPIGVVVASEELDEAIETAENNLDGLILGNHTREDELDAAVSRLEQQRDSE